MVIKILTKLRKRIKEHNENFNKELDNIKKDGRAKIGLGSQRNKAGIKVQNKNGKPV